MAVGRGQILLLSIPSLACKTPGLRGSSDNGLFRSCRKKDVNTLTVEGGYFMSSIPIEDLQLRAVEQRARLHRTATDLREEVLRTRDKLSFSKQAHEHVITMSLMAGVLGLASGYALGGLFTRR
jgi:hypothetical protein